MERLETQNGLPKCRVSERQMREFGCSCVKEYVHRNYGLKKGDRLKIIRWEHLYHGQRLPDKVKVVREYPRFVLVQVFYGARSFDICINKVSVFCGHVVIKRL